MHEGDGGADPAEAAGATDAVEVGLRVRPCGAAAGVGNVLATSAAGRESCWEGRTYVVDDKGDRLDVNAAGENVGGDQNFCLASAEGVDYRIPGTSCELSCERGNSMSLGRHPPLNLGRSVAALHLISVVAWAEVILHTLTKIIDDPMVIKP